MHGKSLAKHLTKNTAYSTQIYTWQICCSGLCSKHWGHPRWKRNFATVITTMLSLLFSWIIFLSRFPTEIGNRFVTRTVFCCKVGPSSRPHSCCNFCFWLQLWMKKKNWRSEIVDLVAVQERRTMHDCESASDYSGRHCFQRWRRATERVDPQNFNGILRICTGQADFRSKLQWLIKKFCFLINHCNSDLK